MWVLNEFMPFDFKSIKYSVKTYNFPETNFKSVGNIEILEGFLTRQLTWMFCKLTIHQIIPLLLQLFNDNSNLVIVSVTYCFVLSYHEVHSP